MDTEDLHLRRLRRAVAKQNEKDVIPMWELAEDPRATQRRIGGEESGEGDDASSSSPNHNHHHHHAEGKFGFGRRDLIESAAQTLVLHKKKDPTNRTRAASLGGNRTQPLPPHSVSTSPSPSSPHAPASSSSPRPPASGSQVSSPPANFSSPPALSSPSPHQRTLKVSPAMLANTAIDFSPRLYTKNTRPVFSPPKPPPFEPPVYSRTSHSASVEPLSNIPATQRHTRGAMSTLSAPAHSTTTTATAATLTSSSTPAYTNKLNGNATQFTLPPPSASVSVASSPHRFLASQNATASYRSALTDTTTATTAAPQSSLLHPHMYSRGANGASSFASSFTSSSGSAPSSLASTSTTTTTTAAAPHLPRDPTALLLLAATHAPLPVNILHAARAEYQQQQQSSALAPAPFVTTFERKSCFDTQKEHAREFRKRDEYEAASQRPAVDHSRMEVGRPVDRLQFLNSTLADSLVVSEAAQQQSNTTTNTHANTAGVTVTSKAMHAQNFVVPPPAPSRPIDKLNPSLLLEKEPHLSSTNDALLQRVAVAHSL